MDGLSTNNTKKCNIEMNASRKAHGVRCPYFTWYLVFKLVVIDCLRNILKSVMGNAFFQDKDAGKRIRVILRINRNSFFVAQPMELADLL